MMSSHLLFYSLWKARIKSVSFNCLYFFDSCKESIIAFCFYVFFKNFLSKKLTRAIFCLNYCACDNLYISKFVGVFFNISLYTTEI